MAGIDCRLLPALAVAAMWSGAAPGGRAGVMMGFDPSSPTIHAIFDRFSGGFPSAPVANTSAQFIGRNYNLSGIGWSPVQPAFAVAMISPQHFIGAFHVPQTNPG